ncbi:hypothetical protein AB0M46_30265 [Dactylosporangium sp. NPDC051485]|uniref:HAAS signaling domain-containing protein n=1 Tax=Dactylosporangium sp. NPDC051485 TaxID=3154846 RepID=UPI003429C563
MNTYDDLVNDYLHAVEQALAGVPANRRAELLADLSEHIAAKRAELSPEQETEVEVRSILELLGDPEEVAAEAMLDNDRLPPPAPVVIQPKKRSAALIWVAVTIVAVAMMCVVGVVLALFVFSTSTNDEGKLPVEPAPGVSAPLESTASSAPTSSPS